MGSLEADDPAKLIECIEMNFGRDFDGWLACFEAPFAFVTPKATVVASDETDARTTFAPGFERLQNSGFAASEADQVSVRHLGADLALVDATFTRRHRDGSQIGRMAALYVCRRNNDRWRIAAVIQHEPEHMALLDAQPR